MTIVAAAPYLAAPDILNCPSCAVYSYEPLTAVGSSKTYNFAVKAGHTYTVTMQPGGGNPNLYAKRGAPPTLTSWDCRPNSTGTTSETCSVVASANGTEYLMVYTATGPGSFLIWACDMAVCK